MCAMGIVLVFDAKMASSGMSFSTSRITWCLTARSSNTASMIMSTLPKPLYSVVPEMRIM